MIVLKRVGRNRRLILLALLGVGLLVGGRIWAGMATDRENQRLYQIWVAIMRPSPTPVIASFRDPQTAIPALRAALSAQPADLRSAYRLAILLISDQPGEAAALLQAGIERNRSSSSKLLITAQRLLDRLIGGGSLTGRLNLIAGDLIAAEDWESAAYLLNRLAAEDGASPRTTALLGLALSMEGRDDGSLVLAAYAQTPDDPTVDYAAAIYWRRRGDLDSAAAALARAALRDPTNPALAVETAGLYRARQQIPEAAGWLEQAVRLAPDELALHRLLCALYVDENYALEGSGAFALATALRKFPNDPELIALFGQARDALGSKDEARLSYERALGLDPDNMRARYALGVWLRAYGDAEGARLAFEWVVQRATEDSPFRVLAERALQ